VSIVPGREAWPESILDTDSRYFRARIRGPFDGGIVSVGDVNGDGFPDLFLNSAVQEAEKIATARLLYLNRDLRGEIDAEAHLAVGGGVVLTIEDVEHGGVGVARSGDVNGDGFADLLLGVSGGGDAPLQGLINLVPGGSQLPSYLTLKKVPDAPDGVTRIFGEGRKQAGAGLGPAGDWNADGYADFLIGAPLEPDEPGKVFLILGRKVMAERIDLARLGGRGIRIEGQNAPGGVGGYVGPHGDLNGDGQPDFAFIERWSLTRTGLERVYVIFGPYAGTTFPRGDANSDGAIDVSDAIYLLSYLFLGGASPLCEDALDVDDRGSLEITDAVYLLDFLFQGGPAPPPPHPLPGPDPTPDPLECPRF
jgi:hypothetical protein